MLCLSRKVGERIIIGEGASQVVVIVLDWDRSKVRLGIEAPKEIDVYRGECVPKTDGEGEASQ